MDRQGYKCEGFTSAVVEISSFTQCPEIDLSLAETPPLERERGGDSISLTTEFLALLQKRLASCIKLCHTTYVWRGQRLNMDCFPFGIKPRLPNSRPQPLTLHTEPEFCFLLKGRIKGSLPYYLV